MNAIDDSGERMIPAYHRGHLVYGEHVIRYRAAVAFVRGARVLDIACGSGYGSRMLAEAAALVVAVDLNEAALRYTRAEYGDAKLVLARANAAALPFADGVFDAVVSFETFEHLPDPAAFLAEVRRVLTPDGIMLLSTPNSAEYPTYNEFHVKEFTEGELRTELAPFFSDLRIVYQGAWTVSALMSAEGFQTEWDGPVEVVQAAPMPLERAVYFLAICANRPLRAAETVPAAVALGQHHSDRLSHEHGATLQAIMTEQKATIAEQSGSAEVMRGIIRDQVQAIADLRGNEAGMRELAEETAPSSAAKVGQ